MIPGLPQDEPLIDKETGEAVVFEREVDGGILFNDDEDVFEFQGVDTGSRRKFGESDVRERLVPKADREKETRSKLEQDPFNLF